MDTTVGESGCRPRSESLYSPVCWAPGWELKRDVAQPGSAPEWGSGGRGFKSRRPDLINQGTVGIYADGAFSLLPNLPCYDSEGFDSCQVSVFFERKDFFVAVPFRVRLENMTGLRVEPL